LMVTASPSALNRPPVAAITKGASGRIDRPVERELDRDRLPGSSGAGAGPTCAGPHGTAEADQRGQHGAGV
jgi:hypothetical protein